MYAAQRRCRSLLLDAIVRQHQRLEGILPLLGSQASSACQQPATGKQVAGCLFVQQNHTSCSFAHCLISPRAISASDCCRQQPWQAALRLTAGIATDAWQGSKVERAREAAATTEASASPVQAGAGATTDSRASKENRPSVVQAFHAAGWTRETVVNLPNALSLGRLISGPFVAHLILQGYWPAALGTLAVAGISDWADGYAAKRWGQSSVLGSYLDPLADKVLVCCTVGALAAEGSLPMPLAGLIIGRDVLLVGGAFVHRASKVGWRRVGWAEFFRMQDALPQQPPQHATTTVKGASLPGGPSSASSAAQEAGSRVAGADESAPSSGEMTSMSEQDAETARAGGVPPAPFVQPLYISKVNTVFQLSLIAGCIGQSWYGWPTPDMLYLLGGATGVLTVGSFAAYVRAYR